MMTLVSEGVPWTLLARSSEHWPHFSSARVRSEDLLNGYYPMKRTLERKIRRRNIDCTRRYTFSSIRDICRTFPISEIIALCWSRWTIAIFSSSSTTLSSSWKIVNNVEAQRTTIKKNSHEMFRHGLSSHLKKILLCFYLLALQLHCQVPERFVNNVEAQRFRIKTFLWEMFRHGLSSH